LAFATAFKFLKEIPIFVQLDDISFVKPVYVGEFLLLKSMVVYSENEFIHVGKFI
jgi:acyl-CoA hydrolase